MSNPLTNIREGLQTAMSAVDGIKWADIYDGEDWKDDEYKQIRRRVGLQGTGVYARLMRTQLVVDSPQLADSNDVYMQLIVGCAQAVDRKTSAENAEQQAWDCYYAVRGTATGADCLLLTWRLAGIATEYQSSNCTIMSVILRNQVDFGTWDE